MRIFSTSRPSDTQPFRHKWHRLEVGWQQISTFSRDDFLWKTRHEAVALPSLSRAFAFEAIVLTQARYINATLRRQTKTEGDMAEYQDILRFLASNPPHMEQEKRLHASLLEMLAKKLRGEENKRDFEPLKEIAEKPNYKKGYH